MTALTPAQKERQRFARQRAGRIRSGIVDYLQTLGVIALAYQERDHLTLGYDSWAAYVDGEYGALRLRLPEEHRAKAIEELRLGGLSQRAIATTLGVSRNTVAEQVAPGEPPGDQLQASENTDPPARSPLVEAVEAAIKEVVDAVENAITNHPVPAPGEADATPPASEPDVLEEPSPSVADVADNPSAGPEPEPPTGSGPLNLPTPGGEEYGTAAVPLVAAPCPTCGQPLP